MVLPQLYILHSMQLNIEMTNKGNHKGMQLLKIVQMFLLQLKSNLKISVLLMVFL